MPIQSRTRSTVTNLLPGIYGLDDAVITVKHQMIAFTIGRSQDDVLTRLAVSQWRMVSLGVFAPGLYLMILADQIAMLRMRGNDAATAATITSGVPVPLTISGAQSASGTSQFLTFFGDMTGISGGPDDPTDVSGTLEGPDGIHAMLQFSVPHKLGQQPVALDDSDAIVTLFTTEASFFEAMIVAQKSGVQPDPSIYQEYRKAAGSSGTATITSLDPFAGTVRLTGLADDNGRTIDIETGFSLVAPILPPQVNAPPTQTRA
jgi:hypothetical protein